MARPRALGTLRCLIDSMIFDAIAEDRELLSEVDRLTRARRVELLAAAETMGELAAVPDPDRRRSLQKVRVLVVPPAPTGPLYEQLMAAPGVSDEDARIALAATASAVPLVTEDRDLRAAAGEHLPGLELWRWADLQGRLALVGSQT